MPRIDQIVVSAAPGEWRIALLAEGVPVELAVDRGDAAAGDIVLGRVLAVRKGLGAAFVDIGEAMAGFLPSPGRVAEGQAVLVQVAAAARRGKGAALTLAAGLTGPLLAYTPSRPGLNLSKRIADPERRRRLTDLLRPHLAAGEGLVVRTQAAAVEDAALTAELDGLRERWQAIAAEAARRVPPYRLHAPSPLARLLAEHPGVRQVRLDDPAALSEARVLFPDARLDRRAFEDCGAAEALEAALEPACPLPGGGGLIIEETAGATVIDVDGGGRAPLEANLQAVGEVARQLRLRGIGGHVLVDVIPLRERGARARVAEALRQAVADDPTPTQVVGVTPLGLVELTRERRRPSLAEVMLAPPRTERSAETLAVDALRALLAAALAQPAAHPGLAVAPAVMAALNRRPAALAEAGRRLGRPVRLVEDRTVEAYQVIEDR